MYDTIRDIYKVICRDCACMNMLNCRRASRTLKMVRPFRQYKVRKLATLTKYTMTDFLFLYKITVKTSSWRPRDFHYPFISPFKHNGHIIIDGRLCFDLCKHLYWIKNKRPSLRQASLSLSFSPKFGQGREVIYAVVEILNLAVPWI